MQTTTATRVLYPALIAAVVAVAAILAVGLAPQGVFFTPPSAQEQMEDAYLDGLRVDAPGLWALPIENEGVIVELGYRMCGLAAENDGSWAEGVTVLTGNGVDPDDAGALTFHATRYLCPQG